MTAVCAGAFHSCCVTVGGRVFSWGMNSFGALGLRHLNDQGTPKQISFPQDELDELPQEATLQGDFQSSLSGQSRPSVSLMSTSMTDAEMSGPAGEGRRQKGMSFSNSLKGRVYLYSGFYSTTILCLPWNVGLGAPAEEDPSNDLVPKIEQRGVEMTSTGVVSRSSTNSPQRALLGIAMWEAQ